MSAHLRLCQRSSSPRNARSAPSPSAAFRWLLYVGCCMREDVNGAWAAGVKLRAFCECCFALLGRCRRVLLYLWCVRALVAPIRYCVHYLYLFFLRARRHEAMKPRSGSPRDARRRASRVVFRFRRVLPPLEPRPPRRSRSRELRYSSYSSKIKLTNHNFYVYHRKVTRSQIIATSYSGHASPCTTLNATRYTASRRTRAQLDTPPHGLVHHTLHPWKRHAVTPVHLST